MLSWHQERDRRYNGNMGNVHAIRLRWLHVGLNCGTHGSISDALIGCASQSPLILWTRSMGWE